MPPGLTVRKALPPVLTGDFSVSDLVREAAERSIAITRVVDPPPIVDRASMTGTLIAEEVQTGLIMSAGDLTYTMDGRLSVEMERIIVCGILLAGAGEALEFAGFPPIRHELQRAVIYGCGETRSCARPWREGQHSRVFAVSIKPTFFERFAPLVRDDGLETLQRFIEPGVHTAMLPWSTQLVDLGNACLEEPYGGTLRSLFREAQALRFILEATALLQEEERMSRLIGRRQYERAREARERLDRALVEPPSLLELARDLAINVSTLQANFKAAFGTTVFGYVRRRRLDMARVLISELGLGIAEASYKVGFTNAAAFTAAYRKHFGHPPSADRRSGL